MRHGKGLGDWRRPRHQRWIGLGGLGLIEKLGKSGGCLQGDQMVTPLELACKSSGGTKKYFPFETEH